MAYVANTQTANAGIVDRIAAFFKTAAERNVQYRIFRQTVNELSALSTRDLADLGIHRGNIKSIAMEAAYGK